MHHPSERYIKFLLAESWGDEDNQLTLEVMRETLKAYSLLDITEEAFNHIVGEFQPPDGFRFASLRHQPSADFMKQEEISSLWKPNSTINRMLRELLGCKLIVECTHILLMGFVPSDVIATLVNRRFRLMPLLTGDMVDGYKHYFWDVAAWTELEWEVELRNNPHSDRFLASLRFGEQQALFRAGFNPKYDYQRALRDMHRQISFRIQAMSFMPDDKFTIDLLIKMSREERALNERLHGQGGGLLAEAKKVRQFMEEHRIADVKKLNDFIGVTGSISGDGNDRDVRAAKDDEVEDEDNEETEEE